MIARLSPRVRYWLGVSLDAVLALGVLYAAAVLISLAVQP